MEGPAQGQHSWSCLLKILIGEQSFFFYRHSLWIAAPTNFICVCVCPAFMAYISLTIMGRILIKLGENVGT